MDKPEALDIIKSNPSWGQWRLHNPALETFCSTGWLLHRGLGVPCDVLAYNAVAVPVDERVPVPDGFKGYGMWSTTEYNVASLLAILVDGTDGDFWSAVLSLNDTARNRDLAIRAIEYYFNHEPTIRNLERARDIAMPSTLLY